MNRSQWPKTLPKTLMIGIGDNTPRGLFDAFVLRAVMYPLSIHSHISHSKETLIWARYVGLPARMNIREKSRATATIDFQLCRKLKQRND
jgi:hypothetical protein